MIFKFRSLALLFLSIQALGQDHTLFCKQLEAVHETVNQHHYNPKPVDDDFSTAVYHLFINKLDDRQHLFTQEDLHSFSKDSLLLDDYVKNNDCDFILKYTSTLDNRIQQSKAILENLKSTTFDYTGKDTLYFDADKKFKYFKSEAHQKRYWNKRVRYEIITSIIEKDSLLTNAEANFTSLEKTLKPKIIQQQICILDELLNQNGGIERFVKEAFLNAYLHYQDPNSTFFNASEKTQFETSVSNNQLSFGLFTGKNKNGEIIITYIQPGSSAFKNGTLEVNDIVKSLESNGDVLETYCVANNDIMAFLNDSNHKTVHFELKKQNGTIQTVRLTKIKSEVETNNITGYIIKNEEKNIGYIKIPGFYTDLETPNGLGVANDVAKELYKLQKESINGLILDLRFNSGGSMKEATDLSGMFINRGPLAIIKHNNGEQFTIKDSQRGSLFNKPLLILINGYSASASEFFAGAMQDYNRAVVVGSPSYGKATAQVILPLHENSSYGFVKLTVEKFYRATGKSHQQLGVNPDIKLPSVFDNFDSGEKNMPYALGNDTILPQLKLMPLKKVLLKDIANKSYARQKQDSSFLKIQNVNTAVLNKLVHKKKQYPLTLNNIYDDFNEFKTIWNAFNSLKLEKEAFQITNSDSTTEIISYSDEDKQQNQEYLTSLSRDVYINEAQKILTDIINQTNNH
ncbi:carboxy terminal-processing peptidase [Hanstruepera ponticola]|uniref:carboxy terminal-processing peptidase n=1 Tax=Hanstruepera ponticola TaxID=2042995 RepID=UPI001784E7D5|nr:carboxy terminal-processing peptidase [Hanstruepera ponticola]